MVVMNIKANREVKVGDWITRKDYKGGFHRYEVLKFDAMLVEVAEHHNDSRYYITLPYHTLGLRVYVG
jgi:hypothetical protein